MDTANFSRRNFLAGSVLGIAGITGASVLGACSPASSASSASKKGDASGEAAQLKTATQTRDADIVIVGSGAAGCFAAYEAKKQGIDNVLVVTKSGNATDSNFNVITGTCAVETEGTRSIGQDYTLDQLYQRMISFAHWTVNAKLLKNCVMLLSEDIDILAEMGVQTAILGDRYNAGFTCVHGFTTMDKGVPVEAFLKDKGVEFLYDAPASHILMEGGKAVGVQVEQGSEVINVNAKAVLV
ncbi:MAG: FAD-dependent oxidoreductase, partial [Coriobacteriaceae bacterium]|nr:FAD-dependent oxidoreductase [Coriobacteriaceae bacterium]